MRPGPLLEHDDEVWDKSNDSGAHVWELSPLKHHVGEKPHPQRQDPLVDIKPWAMETHDGILVRIPTDSPGPVGAAQSHHGTGNDLGIVGEVLSSHGRCKHLDVVLAKEA